MPVRFALPALVLSLLLAQESLAQAPSLAQSLDRPFEQLSWQAETSTGILANRRAFLLDPVRYTGQASADTLAPMEWEVLYGQLRMSAANPQAYLPPSTFTDRAETHVAQGRLPIGLLLMAFDYLDPASYSNGRLQEALTSAGWQLERPTAPSSQVPNGGYGTASTTSVYTAPSPYAVAQTFAAAPLYGSKALSALAGPTTAGRAMPFVVPSNLVVGLASSAVTGLQVDAGEGAGWRAVSFDTPFSVTYPTSGVKVVGLRATVHGQVRTARFSLRVEPEPGGGGGGNYFISSKEGECMMGLQPNKEQTDSGEPLMAWDYTNCRVVPGPEYAWSPGTNYPSVHDSYEVHRTAPYRYAVKLATNNTSGRIRNPIVLVSGFDPFERTGLFSIYNLAVGGERAWDIPVVGMATDLRNQGYDIVIFDYEDSHDFIQRNALSLTHLIRHLHADMDGNPEATKRIPAIIGYSMGGLVTRMALAQMETLNPAAPLPPHRVGLFVSYDSPHQGATVPVWALMAQAHLSGILQVAADAVPSFSPLFVMFTQSPSPQQLLTFWPGTNAHPSPGEGLNTPIRQHLYSAFSSVGDYPNRLRRVAVSNGNPVGLRQLRTADPRNRDGTGQRIAPGQLVINGQIEGGSYWGLVRGKVWADGHTPVAGAPGRVFGMYKRACFMACDEDDTATLLESTVTLSHPHDLLPGGYQDDYRRMGDAQLGWSSSSSFGLGLVLFAGFTVTHVEWNAQRHLDRYAFVPTVSGLDYNATNTDRAGLLTTSFVTQDLSAPLDLAHATRTPFDFVYAAGMSALDAAYAENQDHLMLTPGIKAFIISHLGQGIPNRNVPLFASITELDAATPASPAGHWYAQPTGGQYPYRYEWHYSVPCAGGGGGGELRKGGSTHRENCGVWNALGVTTRSLHYSFYDRTYLRLTVQDAANRVAQSQVMVGYGSTGGGGGGGALAARDAAEEGAALAAETTPQEVSVSDLTPNPARERTLLRLGLPDARRVSVVVYDLLGRAVHQVPAAEQGAGWHRVALSTEGWPAGLYLVRVEVGQDVYQRRLVVR